MIMWLYALPFLIILSGSAAFGQSQLTVNGDVADAVTKEPVAYATISIKGSARGTVTDANGRFILSIPRIEVSDTLVVSHIGYSNFEAPLPKFEFGQTIYLEESYTLLDVVTISRAMINVKGIEKDLRRVSDGLYAMETEVTNGEYNLFLASLEENGRADLFRKCNYDLSGYNPSEKSFFTQYVTQYKTRRTKKDSLTTPHIGPHSWGDYPAINVTHAAALEYCKWLTDEYNRSMGKKKFKRVRFKLPSLEEWQIAALGYDKFNTWNVADVRVEVIISPDSLEILPRKGQRKFIAVGSDVLYPWYGSYYYRRSPQNHRNCFLGNFKVEYVERPCPANNPSYDGWSMMGRTASYFPNNIGLYDVVGNVAEMIEQPGKACGGSWDDVPSESTIHSVKTYTRPDATIGFRVFMEVLEN